MLSPSLQEKYARVQRLLGDLGHVAVAFSGGVDSTLLLRVALDTLGREHVLAIVGVSELTPAWEIAEAEELAKHIGVRYSLVHARMLQDASVAANPPNRCFFCKTGLFSKFATLAAEQGFTVLVDGANADDTGDWRPGQQAARNLGVRSPLMETGLTKAEIRDLSRALGLPTWQKPSYACLASRIPYGTPLTVDLLAAVDAAEAFFRELGFQQMRVRHHGELARIEVTEAEMPRLLDPALRPRILARLRELGYHYVTLDLQGYRTGSMNEVL